MSDSLFDAFKSLSDKIVSNDQIKTDSFVFRLHYIGTVGLLLTFSVLLSLSQVKGSFHVRKEFIFTVCKKNLAYIEFLERKQTTIFEEER